MMVNAKFVSFLMPLVAGGVLLWYKKRNSPKREEKGGNESGEGGGGSGGREEGRRKRRQSGQSEVSGEEMENNNNNDDNNNEDNNNGEQVEEIVDLGSSLVSFRITPADEDEEYEEENNDDAPLPVMPSVDDDDDDGAEADVDDADLSDVEFHQKRVLDWAEERVSISEADLGADLESLLKSYSENVVDDSPSSRRLRMRQSPGRIHAAGRTASETSRVSSSAGSGEDYGLGSSALSWRHNSGGDACTPISSSPWNSVETTPDPKRLMHSGFGEDSIHSTPSGTGERVCPVISCTPSTPTSGLNSSAIKRNGSDCDNWRQNMGQWDGLARPSHNSPIDRCSEISSDSGRGGSEGVPSLSIASPGDVIIYEFAFPSELCGRLIGKGGRNLHQLMHETTTEITLRKQPFQEDHQIVSVNGRQEDVQAVLQSVRHKFPRHKHPDVDLRPVELPLPEDFLAPDMLPLTLPEGVVIDVKVSAVVATGHVFLQMPLHCTFGNLSHLDACMLACYCQGNAPSLPTPVEPGVICAAPQSGGWYRAQIVDIFPSAATTTTTSTSTNLSSKEDAAAAVNSDDDDNNNNDESHSTSPLSSTSSSSSSSSHLNAHVRFVDYGGYSLIPLEDLRQIRSDFVALPFQAIECYLANVIPPNEESYEWPLEGAFFLERLVKKAQAANVNNGTYGVQAQVIAYAEGDIPCVYLYPISSSPSSSSAAQSEEGASSSSYDEDKLSFNESLVIHGHAKFIPLFDSEQLMEGGEEEEEEEEEEELEVEGGLSAFTTGKDYSSSTRKSMTTSFTEDDAAAAKIFTPKGSSSTTTTTTTAAAPRIEDAVVAEKRLAFVASELDVPNDVVDENTDDLATKTKPSLTTSDLAPQLTSSSYSQSNVASRRSDFAGSVRIERIAA